MVYIYNEDLRYNSQVNVMDYLSVIEVYDRKTGACLGRVVVVLVLLSANFYGCVFLLVALAVYIMSPT